jgi:Ser/Thr protein kinase RdoA (MazF antagonist)
MKLFQPNDLSRTRPEFVAVHDAGLSRIITSLLHTHYGLSDLSSLEIARFGGANIVSQNFRLTVRDSRYFLKSRPSDKHHTLDSEADLATRLREMGLRVPRIIRSATGAYTSLHEERCWSLNMFEQGNYFTGRDSELDKAASAFSKLTLSAIGLPGGYFSDNGPVDNAFLQDLASLLNQTATDPLADKTLSNLCLAHRDVILKHLQMVIAKRSFIESVLMPVHLDYHPLNLLIRNGEVGCILDLEHFKIYPVLAGLGFAAYKLIRQVMIDPDVRAHEQLQPRFVGRWLEGWRSSFPGLAYRPDESGMGASYRVLWLIHFILDASVRRNDHRFDFDLAKQIGSLYEIEVIFGTN